MQPLEGERPDVSRPLAPAVALRGRLSAEEFTLTPRSLTPDPIAAELVGCSTPRGRRLRAALAAVLVRDHAPELRLMRELLDTWHGIRAGATLTLAMQDL